MSYIFLACGILIGVVLSIFLLRSTTIGNLVIIEDEGEGESLIFLELNDHDSIDKAKTKRYIRMKVIKRKNYN